MKKRNPISFLEDSFNSFKNYLEDEFTDSTIYFEDEFISKLKSETAKIKKYCQELSKENSILLKLNSLVNNSSNTSLFFSIEQFFLSDIISLYIQNKSNENEKSRFVIAYYYDVLINNHFADEKAINTLNKIVSSKEFQQSVETIIQQNRIVSSTNNGNQSYLMTVLKEFNNDKFKEIVFHYENFAQYAFNLKFDKEHLEKIEKTEAATQNNNITNFEKEDSLDIVLKELNQLVGLEKIKTDVNELINLLEIQKKRNTQGLKNIEITLHTVFIGPPGTGKTSVARLLSRIYKHLGFLSKGQLYETDREGMIAGYVGQTATKVDKVLQESKGGVLFIDEAYGLSQNTLGSDYGAEAVNTLLKRMEDFRDDLAVVVAGYKEPMQLFIDSNPGLKSRFNRYFFFDHFTPSQLLEIFESFCIKSDFILSTEAGEKIKDTFELLYEKKDESFGNARVARNIFEKCVQNQANRIIKIKKISKRALKTITEEDIPEPLETVKQVFME